MVSAPGRPYNPTVSHVVFERIPAKAQVVTAWIFSRKAVKEGDHG
jgi:hypothetical protein